MEDGRCLFPCVSWHFQSCLWHIFFTASAISWRCQAWPSSMTSRQLLLFDIFYPEWRDSGVLSHSWCHVPSVQAGAHIGLCFLPARTIDLLLVGLQALLVAHSLSKFAQRTRNGRRNRDRLAETRFPPHLFQSWCLLGWFTHHSEWAEKMLIGVVPGDSHHWSVLKDTSFQTDWATHTEMKVWQ